MRTRYVYVYAFIYMCTFVVYVIGSRNVMRGTLGLLHEIMM